MTIERKIKINDRYHYFLGIELMYNADNCLCKADGSYFDMGDLSIMIDEFESRHEKDSKEIIYDKLNSYMNDIIYLYDRFPFVSYIKDVTYNDEGKITCVGCISKAEIIKYITNNKIEINKWDNSNCRCPLLYE
ncbi:MAG: hypothetical protein J5634_03375 [Bacilli bacterium]|nr:hypothetical protein [Bacilli bacterium]